MNVKTNIAKKFLQLVDKHFPVNHNLHKAFNRNNVKVSYSCMPNTASVIKAHNKRILQDQHTTTTAECNCRKKEICPLKGECLTENVIYMAKVSNIKNNRKVIQGQAQQAQKLTTLPYKSERNGTFKVYPGLEGQKHGRCKHRMVNFRQSFNP